MEKQHYIYLIREQKVSHKAPVKLGVAIDPKRRMRTMQTGNPRELVLVGLFGPYEKGYAFAEEKRLHRELRSCHLRGEWFSGKILRRLEGLLINHSVHEDYLTATHRKAELGRLKVVV